MIYLVVNFSIIVSNITQDYKVETVFIITIIMTSGGIEAISKSNFFFILTSRYLLAYLNFNKVRLEISWN